MYVRKGLEPALEVRDKNKVCYMNCLRISEAVIPSLAHWLSSRTNDCIEWRAQDFQPHHIQEQ
jgi:hypothetical protein